jgi:hypothetical protein
VRRWQEPGDLNWSEPSALLKLACCRAGSALVRTKTSSIQHHHHDLHRGSRGGMRAGEQASRGERGGELSRGRQGLQTRTRHRAFALARWWKLQNNRDASLPTLPRHGVTASLPSEHWAAPTCRIPDRKQTTVPYWCSVLRTTDFTRR